MWKLRSRDIKDLFKITQSNLKAWASPFPSPHLHSSSFFFPFKNWNEIHIQRWDCLHLTATITTRLDVKQLSSLEQGSRQEGRREESLTDTAKRTRRQWHSRKFGVTWPDFSSVTNKICGKYWPSIVFYLLRWQFYMVQLYEMAIYGKCATDFRCVYYY